MNISGFWTHDDGERHHGEQGERPHAALKHPPRAADVLHVCEVEKARYDGNWRGPLEEPDCQFLRHGVHKQEVDDAERYEERLPHQQRFFSISLWHSMQVRTNGWLRSRGLRMSWPHTVQTP